MILRGLKFGMLLQFSIGPMCLMVFNASATYGFVRSLHLVFAIAIIDALYIALSSVGIVSVINKTKVTATIKLIGCSVLILFGANILSGVFNVSFIPSTALLSNAANGNLFIQGLLLAASNPLTIVFWSGMFSAQMMENQWNTNQLFLFAAGCVMATIIFLTAVAFLGTICSGFLPQIIMNFLNMAVGIFLIVFGLRLLCKKDKSETTAQ